MEAIEKTAAQWGFVVLITVALLLPPAALSQDGQAPNGRPKYDQDPVVQILQAHGPVSVRALAAAIRPHLDISEAETISDEDLVKAFFRTNRDYFSDPEFRRRQMINDGGPAPAVVPSTSAAGKGTGGAPSRGIGAGQRSGPGLFRGHKLSYALTEELSRLSTSEALTIYPPSTPPSAAPLDFGQSEVIAALVVVIAIVALVVSRQQLRRRNSTIPDRAYLSEMVHSGFRTWAELYRWSDRGGGRHWLTDREGKVRISLRREDDNAWRLNREGKSFDASQEIDTDSAYVSLGAAKSAVESHYPMWGWLHSANPPKRTEHGKPPR